MTEHKCEICGKEFKFRSSLRAHSMTHSSIKFKCNECSKEFSCKSNLKRHLASHSDVKEFKCHLCNRGFLFRHRLDKHTRVHAVLKEFKCEICGKEYSHKKSLMKHLPSHTVLREFKCQLCDKDFKTQFALNHHMKTHDKNYVCPFCGEIFHERNNFKVHLTKHAGMPTYKCHLCGKEYAHKSSYKSHLNVHARCGQNYVNQNSSTEDLGDINGSSTSMEMNSFSCSSDIDSAIIPFDVSTVIKEENPIISDAGNYSDEEHVILLDPNAFTYEDIKKEENFDNYIGVS